jgi:hypothetical protein
MRDFRAEMQFVLDTFDLQFLPFVQTNTASVGHTSFRLLARMRSAQDY